MDHLLHSTKRAESVPESLAIDKSAVEMLVWWYACEAGVRTLANYIDKITKKLALQLVVEGEGTTLNEKSSTRKSNSWNLTEDNVAEC
jgi:ATP-dependent Lon protease